VTVGRLRPVWAEVDLEAIRHNCRVLCELVAPAGLCAVVKADAYGHGAVAVSRAVLEAGASALAVALVEEGLELREGGIGPDVPVLVLAEAPEPALAAAVDAGLALTVCSVEAAAAVARAAKRAGRRDVEVHVKVDTGMHRLGASPEAAPEVVAFVARSPELRLGGLWTHFAVADSVSDPFTAEQLARFLEVGRRLEAVGIEVPLRHAANSAAALSCAAARLDLVRCGLSLYGYLPSQALLPALGGQRLRPALSLKAEVTRVQVLDAGEAVSYGRRRPLPRRSAVATVPAGYADGVPWRLFPEGEVLVGGRRCPLAGAVTMDHVLVDCGPDAEVRPGDEVVLLGRQGAEAVTAEDWARAVGTIAYEILVGVGPRVPRRFLARHDEGGEG
jgi:alanine racemase